MPVTAKLSRNFYERLGDDIAGELVDWFNSVDEEYRRQYREANDLNWERFKAFHRGELAEFRREVDASIARSEKGIRSDLDVLRADFSESRLEVAASIARSEKGIRADFSESRRETDASIMKLGDRFSDFRAEIMKWMFVYWVGSTATLAGLMTVLLELR